MGQMTKTPQKLDSKIREIDWSPLMPTTVSLTTNFLSQGMTGNGNNTNLLKFGEMIREITTSELLCGEF